MWGCHVKNKFNSCNTLWRFWHVTVVILFAKRALCVFGQLVLFSFPEGLSGWLVALFFAPCLLIGLITVFDAILTSLK